MINIAERILENLKPNQNKTKNKKKQKQKQKNTYIYIYIRADQKGINKKNNFKVKSSTR